MSADVRGLAFKGNS